VRIVLLGHRDIASNIALSLFVTAMPQHRHFIMLSGSVASQPAPREILELAELENKLCDQLERLPVDGSRGILPFGRLEECTGSRLRTLAQPNSEQSLAALAELQPDLIISARYRRILKGAAIAIPKSGVLNLHSGLLPGYRGMMATFWAMLNNEPIIGSTLHYIVDDTIDTGPVIGRAAMPADRSRTYLANVLSLYPAGCRMLIEAVSRIERGSAITAIRQTAQGRYFSTPDDHDLARFQQADLRLFDGSELQQFLHEYGATIP